MNRSLGAIAVVSVALLIACSHISSTTRESTDRRPAGNSGAVPTVIYHFGAKKYLLEDISARSIPEDAWVNSIMGDHTRFNLKPYRRGLYGSTTPGAAVAYGDDELNRGELPWFMAIEIKVECRQPESVLHGFYNLSEDSRFAEFFSSHPHAEFSGLKDFKSSCLGSGDLSMFQSKDKIENKCEKIVHAFMDATSIKLVADDAWENSWYIRDRTCITNIQGTPTEILSLMASLPQFWSQKSFGDVIDDNPDSLALGSGYLVMLIDSLQSLESVDEKLLSALKKTVGQSDISDFQEDPPVKWIQQSGLQSLKAWERCQKRDEHDRYQAKASDLLNELWREVKIPIGPRPYYLSWAQQVARQMAGLCLE